MKAIGCIGTRNLALKGNLNRTLKLYFMSKLYMGIDVGGKGFITTQKEGVFSHYSIADNDLYQLSEIMAEIRKENTEIVCVIEDVHSIFGSSAKATFNFGLCKGYLLGLLAANRIPYHLIPPKEWQKEIWSNADKITRYKTDGGKMTDTKNTSINACKRIFPHLDLRKTPKCKNVDDNKVDSILMSEYARRKNL